MDKHVTLTADTTRRMAMATRTVESIGTTRQNNGAMYRVPKLPFPLGKNFSFGIGFPSVLGSPADMSTVAVLQPGPITTADDELYLVPSSTVTLRHNQPYYQLCMYGDTPSGLSLVAVPASTENDIAGIAISNPYNLWLYTVRMRSTWIDSVIPRDWMLISDGTASIDDNPVLSDGHCYKCPRRFDGSVEGGDDATHPGDGTASGGHPGDGGVDGSDGGDGGVDAGDTLHPYVCPPCLYGKTLPPST